MKISITVPIYKVEEYLPQCIESIINQTYTDIEILLIDDGSPDRCGAICDEYATKDSRIKVFHIPNGGVAKARQLGVENSTGEYLIFVDPDDWLPIDAIEVLALNIDDNIDLVIGATKVYSGDKLRYYNYLSYSTTRLLHSAKNASRIIERDDYLRDLITWSAVISPWSKLYKRNLFTKDSFPNIKRTQDLLMNIEISIRIRKIKYIDHVVYCYLGRNPLLKPSSFKSTYEYEKMLCEKIKSLLSSSINFDEYRIEYAKCVLNCIRRTIYAGGKIDLTDSLIKETRIALNAVKLEPQHHQTLMALNFTFLYRYLYWRSRIKYVCLSVIYKLTK